MDKDLIAVFIGKEVKCPYRDDTHYKIARGFLTDITDTFLKIEGKLGIIIINLKNVERITLVEQKEGY